MTSAYLDLSSSDSESSNPSESSPSPPPHARPMYEPEPEPVPIRCRRRFIPLKNPLNNVPHLTEDHFKNICLKFYEETERELEEQEARFEKTIENYQKEIREMHRKLKDTYQNLYQFMLNHVYDEDKKELLEAISLMLEHPEYAEGFASIMKSAIQFLNEGKRPGMVHDHAQYVYGTKPLYFDFDKLD